MIFFFKTTARDSILRTPLNLVTSLAYFLIPFLMWESFFFFLLNSNVGTRFVFLWNKDLDSYKCMTSTFSGDSLPKEMGGIKFLFGNLILFKIILLIGINSTRW